MLRVLVTWYFLFSFHAAYWHGQTPEGWPNKPDLVHHGCACPEQYSFGDRFLLRANDRWTVVTCVDRTANLRGWDLWPAAARDLGFGPTYGADDVGVIEADIVALDTRY